MNTEHVRSARTPSLRTGLFASLSGLLRAKGSGASSSGRLPVVLIASVAGGASLCFATAASAADPTVTVDPITNPGITVAHATGTITVDSEANGGSETYYFFEYTEAGKAQWTPGPLAFARTVPAPTTAEAVEEDLTGLKPASSYEVRLAALPFAGGTFESAPSTPFTTDPAPNAPAVKLPAPAPSYTTAKLQGTVDPEGGNLNSPGNPIPIHWAIETSETGNPDSWSPAAEGDIVEGPAEESNPIAVPESPAEAVGLTPNTTYHYRLRAVYAGQTVETTAAATFTTKAVAAPTVEFAEPGAISALTATSAHFFGQINPNAPEPAPGQDPAFNVEWHYECTPACPGLEGFVEADNSAAEVPADATGLLPGTTYEVSLVAKNAGGPATETLAGPLSFTTDPVAPTVAENETYVSDVTSQSATLHAAINPGGATTSYHFQYVDDATFQADQPNGFQHATDSPESSPVGSDLTEEHPAAATVSLLSPDTTYHYRVIATNTVEALPGPVEVLHTFPAPGTTNQNPDNRAYELVSPPEKNGGDIYSAPTQTRVATDGNAVQFVSSSSFGGAGIGTTAAYIATRGSEGWDTHGITPTQHSPADYRVALGNQPFWQGSFSPDLSTGIFYSPTAIDSSNPNVTRVGNLYLAHNLTDSPGNFSLLSDAASPLAPTVDSTAIVNEQEVGATPDFGQIIFQTAFNLTPDATGQGPKLYEYDHGTLRLASIRPDGTPFAVATAAAGGPPESSLLPYTTNTISRDGSRVFFTSTSNTSGGDLWMRENHSTTVQINASERTPPEPFHAQAVETYVTPDGNHVYFTTTEQLTNDDTNHVSDLYVYEVDAPAGEHLTLISGGVSGGGTTSNLGAMLGASDDGSYVYFMSGDDLVPGQPHLEGTEEAVYLWHDGAVSYVGLGHGSAQGGGLDLAILTTRTMHKAGQLGAGNDIRVSPDGILVFATNSRNLGYDTTARGIECVGFHSFCDEVYVYNPHVGHLLCASCDPTGASPQGIPAGDEQMVGTSTGGNAGFNLESGLSPVITGIENNQYQSTVISEDGSEVYFSSPDRLVLEDTNGRYDAYEYHTDTGQISLISTGQCNCDSFFVNASPDGRNVLFTTRQQLLRIDTDNLRDLYDARVGGGIPAQDAPPPVQCEGDACQQPVTPPNHPTPGTALLNGPGNGSPSTHCPKGKVRKHGNCVKKKSQKHHKNSKKRHANTNRRAAR